jgi:gamma-glutamyltranspeptidase
VAKKSPLRPLHFSEVGRLLQGDYADTLRVISREGESALYGGALGRRIADHTQTINSLFSARFIVHGTGILPNN